MSEPITTNKYFIAPNTGDLAGTWGTAALNPDLQIIDSILGGVLTLSLGAATTILLTTPNTSGVWDGSVGQGSNALIVFTGAQTGTATIQFTQPGFYIVNNKCTGTSVIVLAPASGGGNQIGAPPGRKAHVFFDGTDMDYVNMPEVSSALDLHGVSTTPKWMQACSVLPYLVKDGSLHTASLYPQLAQLLGSTFGGNGASTFGVPDERSRARVGIDIASVQSATLASRLVTAVCGISGTTMGAAGGNQALQTHRHTAVVTDPGHNHPVSGGTIGGTSTSGTNGGGSTIPLGGASITIDNATTNITVALQSTGGGNAQNVQPTIVSFLPLIKT